jgi:hypothetical protein
LRGNVVLLLIGGAFEHGLEEEETEHGEHDEEFHGNNDPKGFTPSHLSETVDVESQRFSERVDNVHVRKKEKKESVNGEGEPRRGEMLRPFFLIPYKPWALLAF